MTQSTPNVWNESKAWSLAGDVMQRLGEQGDVILVRFRQNAIFRVTQLGLTIRIYSPHDDPTRAHVMLDTAKRLAAVDFPAVRPWSTMGDRPMVIDGYQITLWRWLESARNPLVGSHDFGRCLRAFHELGLAPSARWPRLEPIVKIRRRATRLQANSGDGTRLPDRITERVAALIDDAERYWDDVRSEESEHYGLHGDAMVGNAIAGPEHVHLIDFDSVCMGPREWDWVPTLIEADRWRGNRADFSQFLFGYDGGAVNQQRLDALRFVKELSIIVVLCLRIATDRRIVAEIDRRLESLQNRDWQCRWRRV
ncbi:MAG: phosphotransferase [Pseudomonadota bacterium]